jgi:hypothetical protein
VLLLLLLEGLTKLGGWGIVNSVAGCSSHFKENLEL